MEATTYLITMEEPSGAIISQEHAKPQNVWERELLEASEAQLDRTMDAAKAGDMDAFRQGLRDLDTIHDTAKRFDVSVATLAWNARS